jgi:hypothetical protein
MRIAPDGPVEGWVERVGQRANTVDGSRQENAFQAFLMRIIVNFGPGVNKKTVQMAKKFNNRQDLRIIHAVNLECRISYSNKLLISIRV